APPSVDHSSGRPSAISSPKAVATSVNHRAGEKNNATISSLAYPSAYEGWGEGLRSLVVHLPLTRFAEFIIGRRFAPTRWQIDLSPLGRGEGHRFNLKPSCSRFQCARRRDWSFGRAGAFPTAAGCPAFGHVPREIAAPAAWAPPSTVTS